MANNYNYDVAKHDIVLTIGGIPYALKDYGADTKVTIAYEQDFRTEITGTDGDGTTSENHNRNAIVTVKILQSSPLNAVLQTAAYSGEQFLLAHIDKNFSGDVGNVSSKAYFTKIPDLNLGANAGTRDYTIRAVNLIPSFALLLAGGI